MNKTRKRFNEILEALRNIDNERAKYVDVILKIIKALVKVKNNDITKEEFIVLVESHLEGLSITIR